MDNLRLEHPASFSTHSQVGGIHHHPHLLPFTPPSIEFSPQLNKPCTQQSSIPLCSPWASLLTEPRYPHNPSSPDRAIRAWGVTPDPILQEKQGHPIDISAGIPQCAGSSLELLGAESPVLQLKQGNALIASEFGHLRAPMNGARGSTCNLLGENNAVNYFRTDGLHLPGPFAGEDRGDASPLSVVSGGQRASYACRADSFSGRDQRFSGFVCRGGDDSQRAFMECAAAVKTEMMGENSLGLAESFKGDKYEEAPASVGKVLIVKKEQDDAGVTIASLEDGSIGLKLGKRTYYGDVGNGEESSRRASSSSVYCNGSGTKYDSSKNSSNVSCAATSNTANTSANTTITASAATNHNSVSLTTATEKHDSGGWIANKKQKGSTTSAVVPICQAEGCTADLSGAKDYHRRHKVCEWHSKASKATVNNLEQRFCQQCSRFHVLSAFDEGKGSCRRWLAGHNERRRKSPPEPLPFLAPGDFAYFADGRFNGSLHEHSYFWQRRPASLIPSSIGNNAALACHLGLADFPQQETMGNHHALDVHHYMQGLPPGGGSEVGVLDGGGTLMLGNGSALALSTVPSLPAPASSSSVGLLPRISSEMAISGRALSLLSPSLGSPETMSISLGMTTPSIDQILSNTHALTASCHQLASKSNICFSSGIGMSSMLHGFPHSHNHALNSLTSSSSGCTTENDQGEPPMSNFDGHSMFFVHSENSFKTIQDGENSHKGRPVLNLMQSSPEESHHHRRQPQPDLPYVDLPSLSIFNGQNIM